jgi:protein-arginine kinase activator protein McsA
LRDQLLELERALQEAVREERYEMAAQIRDEVEMLRAALAAQ